MTFLHPQSNDTSVLRRVATLATPSIAAIILRLSQLAIMVALAAHSSSQDALELLASFGIIGAVAVMSDSGAGNYLLTQGHSITRKTLAATLRLHSLLSALGGCAAVVYSVVAFEIGAPKTVSVVLALAATQVLDSCVRVARAPLLAQGRDRAFAAADIYLSAVKIPLTVLAISTSAISWLLLLPLGSGFVVALLARQTLSIASPGPRTKRLVPSVLAFGANGAASTLYSQAPLIISGALLPVGSVAILAAGIRIAQSTELVPLTLSQQLIPRIVRSPVKVPLTWAAFVLLGTVLALVLAFLQPVVEGLLNLEFKPRWIFVALLSSIPVKFGNYALSAFTLARGQLMSRLAATLVVGVSIVILALLAIPSGGVVSASFLPLASELLLTVALTLVLFIRRMT